MMVSHKRKGDDVFQENEGPSVVMVGNEKTSINELKTQLQVLRVNDDPLLTVLNQTIENVDGNAAESMLLEESDRIKSQLEKEIQQAKDACQQESNVLSDLANQMDSMRQKRQSLLQEMEKLDRRQMALQSKISMHQEEAAQEIESIDNVEEERKRQVPRLKAQLSLYASTTGIKWDYSNEELLSGSIVRTLICKHFVNPHRFHFLTPLLLVPLQYFKDFRDQEGFQLFSIDPRDHSSMETANRLWSLMEGNPVV